MIRRYLLGVVAVWLTWVKVDDWRTANEFRRMHDRLLYELALGPIATPRADA